MSLRLEEELYYRTEPNVVCECKFVYKTETVQLQLKARGTGCTRELAYKQAQTEALACMQTKFSMVRLDDPRTPEAYTPQKTDEWIAEYEGVVIAQAAKQHEVLSLAVDYFKQKGLRPNKIMIYPKGHRGQLLSGSV